MSDSKVPEPRKSNVVPMLRRVGEAVRAIFALSESVSQLKGKNETLIKRVDELAREVDQQAGQLKVLMEFVRDALNERVDRRAEAAARAVLAERESKPAKPVKPKSK